MGSTGELVALARRCASAVLPAEVLTFAKHCVLDGLGVTLAGAREPLVRILFEQVARADAGDEASLLGFGTRSSLLTAALVHGTAAHALDYDDTHWGIQGHPTAPVLSALWGLAERERVSGRAFLSALVTGVEVECQLGRWLNPQHYARGFHATGTLGTFGAAAAAGQLLGLEDVQLQHAFGLAGTQAAGLKCSFGSMAKPLHVGRAAQNGLMAALLARGGFTGCQEILDDAQGFAATHAELAAPLSAARGPGYEISETLFKYHAACHLTHASMEGLIELMRSEPFAIEEIERLELNVDATCLGVCTIERPETGLQVKFSLKATAAMVLLGYASEDPAAFSDELARSPALTDLMTRVHVNVKPMAATRTELCLRLRGGRTREVAHDSGIPERDLVKQGERLAQKFERIAPLPAAQKRAVRACVAQLEQLDDVRELHQLVLAR
jgi:2-methylcitrate dehydratase PrpD